jgi:glucose-1-phosphate adenylyltransferase
MPQADGDTVLISTGIYVFESEFLAEIVAKDAKQPSSGHDFAADVLPQLIDEGRARAHVFRSSGRAARPYWRDIGTLRSYWQAHMELLGPAPLFELDDPRWPIGRVAARPLIVPRPTVTALGGTIEDCVVSAGCRIAGRVLHSVLSEAVEIGSGADVTNSVLLPGAVVGANSRLRGVIVDAAYPVADGTVIERETENAPPPVLSHHGHGRAAAAERLSP